MYNLAKFFFLLSYLTPIKRLDLHFSKPCLYICTYLFCICTCKYRKKLHCSNLELLLKCPVINLFVQTLCIFFLDSKAPWILRFRLYLPVLVCFFWYICVFCLIIIIIFSVKFIILQSSVGKLWDAAGCAASYLLLDPDDDTMIDNLRYFKQELGDQSLKITARKVTK